MLRIWAANYQLFLIFHSKLCNHSSGVYVTVLVTEVEYLPILGFSSQSLWFALKKGQVPVIGQVQFQGVPSDTHVSSSFCKGDSYLAYWITSPMVAGVMWCKKGSFNVTKLSTNANQRGLNMDNACDSAVFHFIYKKLYYWKVSKIRFLSFSLLFLWDTIRKRFTRVIDK